MVLFQQLTWNSRAATEWIAFIASSTGTYRVVVGDPALSICTTKARTRIPTALLHAGCRLATLRADQTLRSAVGWRSYHGDLARTDADSVLLFVLAVGSARIGVAWVGFLNNWLSMWDKCALCDCITSVTVEASADGHVTHCIANGIDTTNSGAGIHTLVVNTGPLAGTVCVENTLWPAGKVRVAEVSSNAGTGTRPLS